MTRMAMIFLILLRLAIGWHFLVEGVQKIQSVRVGETTTNRPFSSVGYFREANGPGAALMRWFIGDPDTEALAKLTALPIAEGEDPAKVKPGTRLPPLVGKDLEDYLGRFSAHYKLDGTQQTQAEAKLEQAKDKVGLWLTRAEIDDKTPEQTRSYPSGEVKRKMTPADRVTDYRKKLDEVNEAARRNWAFGRDVEKSHTAQLKRDAAALRTGLTRDLDEQYDAYRKDLESLLSPEQKAKGAVPGAPTNSLVGWIDFLTRWGLAVVGACLFVGLFTRCNAWLAAGFLLMTYLAVPAWPWLGSVGPSEGNYLFVNKNVVEMLALCVIGTTASGAWFGVDSIISWLFAPGKGDE